MALMQFVLGSASCAFALCAFILWMRRCDGDRSRLTLSFVWMFLALLFSSRAFVDGQLVPSGVLPPVNLVGGLLMVTLLCLYPIEVIRPGWLNARRLLMLLLPAILIGVIFYLSGIKLRQLQTFGDMLAHIGEPNVYWRLILLFGIILPSALLLHVIPYNWMKSRVRLRWIRHYTYTILLISALYAVFMLTRSASVSVVHLFVCLTLAIIVTYEELFARFCLPSDCPTELPVEPVKSSSPSEEEENPLVIRLNHLLEEEKVWKKPDLTVASLAQMLGTNRSYLAQAIQEAGYVNFADLINRHRVQAFCCIAEDGKVKSVQDALVGFRSKETALRSFKKYTGSLPSEYLMKVAANRSKTSEL